MQQAKLQSTAPVARLLIVEDNPAIRSALQLFFTDQGYSVKSVASAEQAMQIFSVDALTNPYQIVLLDVMLPGLDGISFCKKLRRINQQVGIIIVSACVTEIDQQRGLSSGADDYLSKPFSLSTLLLRVQGLLRRITKVGVADRIKLGEWLEISLSRGIGVMLSGNKLNEISFSSRELQLLAFLTANQDRIVSRDEILEQVWGFKRSKLLVTRTVDIHIAKLRKKIEPNPDAPQFLLTFHARGYQLQPLGVALESK